MKVGVAQILTIPGQLEKNLESISNACENLVSQNAEWIVFPECCDLGWTDEDAQTYAGEIADGEQTTHLGSLAAQWNVYITAGITERSQNRIFNTAVTYDNQGRLVNVHRKLNELDIAHGCYNLGDRLNVFDTPFGKAGVVICSDGFAENQCLTRSLCYMGAQFILSPCSWAVAPNYDYKNLSYGFLWKDCYGEVARKYKIWILGVSNVGRIRSGEWKGYHCIGNSLLINDQGETSFEAPYGDNATSLSVHEIIPKARSCRGTQWDSELGMREH